MSMLANVSKGKIIKPALIAIYGPGGIGKTTWGSNAPNPVFLCAEDGADHLDTSRLPSPKNYEDVLLCVKALLEEKHDYQTLVIDSLDWIEHMLFNLICRRYSKSSIELAAGGYGKGYGEAVDEWKDLCRKLSELRDKRKMNVILIAHPITENVTNPQTQITYQRYELKLHKKSGTRSLITEFVDALFFAGYEIFSSKDGEEVKTFKSNKRVLYGIHDHNDGFDAKNRYGLKDPVPMSMPWDDFIKLCKIKPVELPSVEEIMHHINHLIPLIKDETTKKLVLESIEKNKGQQLMLYKSLERLKALTGQPVVQADAVCEPSAPIA